MKLVIEWKKTIGCLIKMKTYYLKTKDMDAQTLKQLEEIRDYIQAKYKLTCHIVAREYL
jgi:hypothetical protein